MALAAITMRGITGGPRMRRGVWIWLRVFIEAGERSQCSSPVVDYCVGEMPLPSSAFDAIPTILLEPHGPMIVRVEMWTAATADAVFMQFGGSCCIDTAAWTPNDGSDRWYEMDVPLSQKKTAWAGKLSMSSAYSRSPPADRKAGGYIQVVATFVGHKTESNPPVIDEVAASGDQLGFQFSMPHKRIRQRATLRRVNIREVMDQSRVGVLEELLETTLYGKTAADTASESKYGPGLRQALTLLQLSCQYALHSNGELEKNRSELETKVDATLRRIDRLRRLRTRLIERRCNLIQERDVLDCSLDGMKALLHGVDPESISVIASGGEGNT